MLWLAAFCLLAVLFWLSPWYLRYRRVRRALERVPVLEAGIWFIFTVVRVLTWRPSKAQRKRWKLAWQKTKKKLKPGNSDVQKNQEKKKTRSKKVLSFLEKHIGRRRKVKTDVAPEIKDETEGEEENQSAKAEVESIHTDTSVPVTDSDLDIPTAVFSNNFIQEVLSSDQDETDEDGDRRREMLVQCTIERWRSNSSDDSESLMLERFRQPNEVVVEEPDEVDLYCGFLSNVLRDKMEENKDLTRRLMLEIYVKLLEK